MLAPEEPRNGECLAYVERDDCKDQKHLGEEHEVPREQAYEDLWHLIGNVEQGGKKVSQHCARR